MGVFDMARMAQKAMAAKAKMSKMTAAGQKGSVGILINGLYEVLKVEISSQVLRDSLGGLTSVSESDLSEIISKIERDFIESNKEARQNLEKDMSNSTNFEDLKDILGN